MVPSEEPQNDTPHEDQTRLGKLKQQMYSRQEQPVDRPRRAFQAPESAIGENWEDAPLGVAYTPTRNSYSSATITLFIALFIFLIAAGGTIAYIFSGGNVVSTRNIDIVVRGPRTIAGGAPLELQVSVRNNNAAQLELADLIVQYPEGTRTPGDVSLPSEQQRIPLGSIEPGGTRTGSVRAVIFGEEGTEHDIKVAIEYRLRNSSAIFATESMHNVRVVSDTLNIAVDANEEVVSGQSTTLNVTVRSDAEFLVPDAVLQIEYPFGFSITRTAPEAQTKGVWELGDMAPGDTRTVQVVGVLDAASGDERIFRMHAGTRDDVLNKRVDLSLASYEHRAVVARPFLGMELEINGSPANQFVARTGEAIPIQLNWQNNASSPLSDVVIAATVSGSGVDPFNVRADRGFFRSLDSVILWDKTTTGGDLANIIPGGSGTFLIRLTPKESEALASEVDPQIELELHAAGKRLTESRVPETLQSTINRKIKLATDVEFIARALYFENPLGSVGPLPPKVEHETTFGILWEVTNTTSLVRDVTVKATLPPYVRWLDVTTPSIENITFNEQTGEVTWRLGNVLPQTGYDDNAPRRVVFGIGLVPSTIQIGQSPSLVQNQRLDGVDNFVNQPVTIADTNDLTIQLTEAEFAQNYGRVAP